MGETAPCVNCGRPVEIAQRATCEGCGTLLHFHKFELGRYNGTGDRVGFRIDISKGGRSIPVQFDCDTTHPSQRYIAEHLDKGIMYEATTAAAIIQTLSSGDTFFDVGAHCGFFTVLASAIVGEQGRVLAFEPLDLNRRYLAANIATAPNVRVVSAAVSDTAGTISFYQSLDNDGGGALWDVAQHGWNETTRREKHRGEIESTTLDAWADYRPTVVKIDTEGAEVNVLRGASELLAQPQLRLVVAERNMFGLEKMGHTEAELLEIMEAAGFRCEGLSQSRHVGNYHFRRHE